MGQAKRIKKAIQTEGKISTINFYRKMPESTRRFFFLGLLSRRAALALTNQKTAASQKISDTLTHKRSGGAVQPDKNYVQ